MTASRDRKVAAGVLGIALQAEYRGMLAANGPEAINAAAMKLGNTFNENIEFICWVLKAYGGIQQMPIERRVGAKAMRSAPKHGPIPAPPQMPAILRAGVDVDMKRKP